MNKNILRMRKILLFKNLLVGLALFFVFSNELFSQFYDFTLVQRRRYDQIYVEIWVRSLQPNSPKLGNASLVVNYNLNHLSPAVIQQPGVTDSVNHNINQANPIDVINSRFNNDNGYNALTTRTYSPGGYFSLEINHNELNQSGIQPITTGKGSFVGKLVFDIIGNPNDTSTTGIKWSSAGPGVVSIFDINGTNQLGNSQMTNPGNYSVLGITILSPNFFGQVVDRDLDYASMTGVYAALGYPIYFERSVNIRNEYNIPLDNSLGYVFEYSLDDGSNWFEFGRVAENDQAGSSLSNNVALRSGEIANPGVTASYIITTQSQARLTSQNYREPLRVIWTKDKFFSPRSEQARLKITQLEKEGYTPTTNITTRSKKNIYDISDFRLVLGRLFFLQLNGTNDYLKTQVNFSNATQLTVEAWVNLNSYKALGSEPAIVASSGGPNATPIRGSREGAFMLYLKDGRYPAFRVREIEDRGINKYLANVIAYDALPLTSDAEPLADLHSKNWTHIAATVRNNEVILYVNGEIVEKFVNDSAIDIRMLTTVHPLWIGVNPNTSIDATDYLHAGIKKVCVWRNALTQKEIRERVAGVINPSTINQYDDLKKGLQFYYSFEGTLDDAASDTYYQSGAEKIDYYIAGIINNLAAKFRPDNPHVKLTAPVGKVGVLNKIGETFEIRWVSYGFGDIANLNSKDFEIEYSINNGVSWNFANTNATQTLSGANAPDAEVTRAIWEPYFNITGANLRTIDPYSKNTILRIRGTAAFSQNDLNDVSEPFIVAPYFSVKKDAGGIIVIPKNSGMNITGNTAFLEAWIKPYRLPTTDEVFFPIIEKLDSIPVQHHYSLRLLSTGQIQLLLSDAGGVVHTANSDIKLPIIEANSVAIDTPWTHIGVYIFLNDGTGTSEVRFYIDGTVQRGNDLGSQLGTSLSLNRTNKFPLYIGYFPAVAFNGLTAATRGFIGEIREVRFWNGVPNNKSVSGNEPTDLTKFVQGALAVRANKLTPSNSINLHSAFSFNGTSFVVNGYNRAIGSSTSQQIIARFYGTPISYHPVVPYIKLVEPVFKQKVPNSKADVRIRWVGFDYDGLAFYSGSRSPSVSPSLEFSIRGGGGNIIQPYQFVGSDYWTNNKTDAITLIEDDFYRFTGTSSNIIYAFKLDASIADPDKDNDNSFIQGPLSAALTNARLRLTSQYTINGDPLRKIYSEGPLFTITPPSNFTVRVILEGYHNGNVRNSAMAPLASSFEDGGLKIKLFADNAGTLGRLVDSSQSYDGYDDLNPTNRNSGNNRFANVNFVFTDLADGNYWVVVEHINHMPVMSRFPAPFFYEGDIRTTWAIESGWDFESWNGVDDNVLPNDKQNPWIGNFFTAYGDAISNIINPRFTTTGLIFNNGRAGGAQNPMPAMVAGDIDRSGQINAADRVQVRLDDGTGLSRSDVTGDGYVNATDRTIVDRNFGRVSSLFGITIPSVTEGKEPDNKSSVSGLAIKKDYDLLFQNSINEKTEQKSVINPFEFISDKNPELSKFFNKNAKNLISDVKSKNDETQAGISYIVTAEPKLEGNIVLLSMYIQNTGDEFAPANCTFAVNYNSNILKFIDLAGIPDVIFSNRPDVGYATLRTAPTPDAVDPLPDVRTIEIDYDAYANLGGLPVPYEKTYLGTLRFELKDNKNSVVFRWHESCAVHTTKNQIVTEYGDFRQIPILLMFTAKITNPNGGEKINQGKNYQIKWTANGGDKVQIEFSSNSGDTWMRITEEEISIQQKYFDWSVPNIISNNCLVRIIDFETGGELDRSDSTFSIVQSFAQIIRPSSGDIIYIGGSTVSIRGFNRG